MIAAAGACEPLLELLREQLRSGPKLQIDETTVQVLKEPDRDNTTTSYVWVARGGPPETPSTALPPGRPRSPRRSAPLSAALASRSPGPSCANACASTTLVSVSPSIPPTRPRRPQPQRLARAGMIRTVRCLLALIRPLFRCSTRSAPGTHSERNDHRHTPRHLSCNQPRPGARNATLAYQEREARASDARFRAFVLLPVPCASPAAVITLRARARPTGRRYGFTRSTRRTVLGAA